MAKRKINKIKTLLVSALCLIVGFVSGFVANIFSSLPDSFEIPAAVQGSSHVHSNGEISVETVKSDDLSIHFLELGNKYTGDCTFIKVGDTEMLIDAGSRATSVQTIKNYIDQYCTDKVLEYVVVTHAHQDHYAGFATSDFEDSIFAFFEVETIIEFAQTNQNPDKGLYKNYIENKTQESSTVLKATDCLNKTYTLGDVSKNVSFEVLDQKFYREPANSENDYSVCLQITHEGKKFLFTGDLEEDGESSLVDLNKGKLSQVEVYKAGHHGSKTSSSQKLLDVIKPKIVCVCCCAGSSEYTSKNENQFPTQAFIDRVSVHTSNIFVTTLCTNYAEAKFESLNGNIVISSNSTQNVTCSFSNNDTKLKDTEWFKANRKLPENAVA